MKTYKVISPYVVKDKEGNPVGYAKLDSEVKLSDEDGERLKNAKCVEEIEERTTKTPENRSKRGHNKDNKRSNSRASKPK